MGQRMRTRVPVATTLLAWSALALGACGEYDATLTHGFDGDRGTPTPAEPVAQPGDREQKEVVANPFVDAKRDPLSTFGADVDSASYDYFRQSVVDYGGLPGPSYVRIEDFVNFFPYAYPRPNAETREPFAIALAAARHPMGRPTTVLRVGIQARGAEDDEKRPVNLVFLVDSSGSMNSYDKLPLVQLVLSNALDELAPDDLVSIVTYSGEAAVRLAPTPVKNKPAIEEVIRSLKAAGGTAGGPGIQLAYEQARAGFIPGGINHVVLCTDGDFNIGVSSDRELVQLIESQRASGVTLTALGFGHDNLNDSMMEAVSNAGNGIYSVVSDAEKAFDYAREKLLATIQHVAKDMKIQVEFNPEHVRAYRLLGYENRAIADEDFRDDTVDGGEVGAEHRVTALYELVLQGDDIPKPERAPSLSRGDGDRATSELAASELVQVRIRYKEPTASDADGAAEIVRALPAASVRERSDDQDLDWAVAVASFAELLRKSPYARPRELERISAIVEAQKTRDEERGEFAEIFRAARAYLEE